MQIYNRLFRQASARALSQSSHSLPLEVSPSSSRNKLIRQGSTAARLSACYFASPPQGECGSSSARGRGGALLGGSLIQLSFFVAAAAAAVTLLRDLNAYVAFLLAVRWPGTRGEFFPGREADPSKDQLDKRVELDDGLRHSVLPLQISQLHFFFLLQPPFKLVSSAAVKQRNSEAVKQRNS